MTQFHMVIGNGFALVFMAITLLFTAPSHGFWGHLVPGLIFFAVGAALVCASPAYKPVPPSYDQVKTMKRELLNRFFS